jgi:hypothetical protein
LRWEEFFASGEAILNPPQAKILTRGGFEFKQLHRIEY